MTVEQMVASEAALQGVPASLALSLARQESGFRQDAVGQAGEVGVFQLMPGTARDLGVNPYDLSQNISGGITYLRQQYERFGSWAMALAAYNAGPGNVSRGVIPGSTQAYVAGILASAGLADDSAPVADDGGDGDDRSTGGGYLPPTLSDLFGPRRSVTSMVGWVFLLGSALILGITLLRGR